MCAHGFNSCCCGNSYFLKTYSLGIIFIVEIVVYGNGNHGNTMVIVVYWKS